MSQDTGTSPEPQSVPDSPGRHALRDSTLLTDKDTPQRSTTVAPRTVPRWLPFAVYGGMVLALAALAWLAGPTPGALVWPLAVAVIGAVIIWRQADPEL